MRLIENTPEAGNLMGSMRFMGYTFNAAVSDILDNSISAAAKAIHIYFPTDSEIDNCYLAILDNGIGMSKAELAQAMKYGSVDCNKDRQSSDMGRYGLGMKSASLSQCRVLTVISKQGDEISGYSWDYNSIQGKSEWNMIEFESSELITFPHFLDLEQQSSGTLVIWQDFDIISKATNGLVYTTLKEYRHKLRDHIALIFHRFLNEPNGLKIHIDNAQVKGLDPFLSNSHKRRVLDELDIQIDDNNGVEHHIKAIPVVLPYKNNMTEADIKALGGIENMRIKQGFYLYRNKRLIIWGTWFGAQRTELTKNARIMIDIPNSLDDIWSIDVMKKNASMPKKVQNALRKAVETVKETSVRRETDRGRDNQQKKQITFIWDRIEDPKNPGFYYYKINRESEIFKLVRSKLDDEANTYVEELITEIEKGLPIQDLYIDSCNNVVKEISIEGRDNELFQKAIFVIENCKDVYGDTPDDIKEIIEERIMTEEMFLKSDKLKSKLFKYYKL